MKISVIIPIYNAERYIKKSINSVMKQTYQNWEMILIDDGSTDNSSKIIDNISKLDSRIVVIHQKNSGPGIARNRGIEYATGDYAVFLDSDDILDTDYFKLLVPKAQKNDVVFIDILQVTPNLEILKEEKISIYKNLEKEKMIRLQMTGKIPWGGVRKAVSLDLLKKNKIMYSSHKIGEEALYSFQILYAAQKIGFINEKAVYYYVNHENSQSKLEMIDPWGEVVENLKNYLKKNGLYLKFAKTVNAFNLIATVISLDKIEQLCKKDEKRKIAKKRMEYFNSLYDKSVGIDKESMSIKGRIFIPFIKRGIYSPVFLCSKLKKKLKI